MSYSWLTKKKHDRLTEKEAKELWRIEKEGPLMVDKSEDKTEYCLPNGRKIRARTFEKLMRMELLVAQSDGLFGDSQTYRRR